MSDEKQVPNDTELSAEEADDYESEQSAIYAELHKLRAENYARRALEMMIMPMKEERDRLQAENAALREIVRVVAEADNSDSSICYQLCNVRWYGGATDAEEMEMRHDAPCVVEKARALLGTSDAPEN